MWDLLDAVQGPDGVDFVQGGGEAAVDAEHLFFDEGCQGHEVEEVGEVLPHVDTAVLAQALVVEAVHLRDLPRLVVPADEADEIFEAVVAHTVKPEFCYEHWWTENDLVLWDNRRTLHYALGFPVDDYRIIQRATLAGPQPTGRIYEEASA